MVKAAQVFLASVALGALCLTTDALARVGGGGHFGGGHFGGGHFSGGHFGGGHFDGGHFGGGHFDGGHFGGVGRFGATHFGGGDFGRFHHFANFNHHGFIGWYGPVFWPYLYGDVFTYSLWPGAYYDPFWAYGPDYFLSSIYWPGPYYADWSGGQYHGPYDVYGAGAPPAASAVQSGMGQQTVSCSGLAPGVTDLPIESIRKAVQPTADQIRALDDLASAASRASDVVKASCPNQAPLTPLGRLDAVEMRLGAMTQAVQIVRAPLERFYGSLSEGQKERLSAMGASANLPSSAGGLSALCDPRAASFAPPVDRIERTTQPTSRQEPAFEALKAASVNAAAQLQASCPPRTPQTPVERIDAVETRLQAMVQAATSVRPALAAFYATLSDEQKARFNMPASSVNAVVPSG
jgi:hypothetical protein